MGFATGLMGFDADNAEASAQDFNAKSEGIAADQAAAQRLGDLNSTQSAVDAVRSSRGLSVSSPTGLALSQNLATKANMGIQQSDLNYESQQNSDLMQASADKSQAWSSLVGGFIQGGEQASDLADFLDE